MTRLTSWQYRGGEEVLLDVGGQDATEAFEDVGHSDEAREILDGMLVGSLKRQVLPPLLHRPRDSGTFFLKSHLNICGQSHVKNYTSWEYH
jgi:cytochrome b involved in lipid metabolism